MLSILTTNGGDMSITEANNYGNGFLSPDVAYYALGLEDKALAEEQVRNGYSKEEAIVYFTCANVAYYKIVQQQALYRTFSPDELDNLLFSCMEVYSRICERNPYDGRIPFECYVTKFILPNARQAYARGKECDNDHLVQTSKNCLGEKEYYGTNGKMVAFSSIYDEENENLETPVNFEERIIARVDSDSVYVDMDLLRKIMTAHDLLKCVLTVWQEDCRRLETVPPFVNYANDDRVLELAMKFESCKKFILTDAAGNNYLNPSTVSKMLYAFRKNLEKEEIEEIFSYGSSFNANPYLKQLVV